VNVKALKTHWFPVAFSKDVKTKPVAKTLLTYSIVLVRLSGEIHAYSNLCPHRKVPLSLGFVEGESIVCGYHGYKFDKDGLFVGMPGGMISKKTSCLKSFSVIEEKNGLVWIRLSGDRAFKNHFNQEMGLDSMIRFKKMNSDYIHSIENFLDPLHTSFIHKGLIRTDKTSQKMHVSQTSSVTGFVTKYGLESKQNGLLNRVFDPGIDQNIASFEMPGFAKIEYRKGNELIFAVSIFFFLFDKSEVGMFVQTSIKKTWVPSSLKFFVLRPFLELAFYQDKKILERQMTSASQNQNEFLITETDLVIDHLLFLLKNGPQGVDKNLVLTL